MPTIEEHLIERLASDGRELLQERELARVEHGAFSTEAFVEELLGCELPLPPATFDTLEAVCKKVDAARRLRRAYDPSLRKMLAEDCVSPARARQFCAVLLALFSLSHDWKYLNTALKMLGKHLACPDCDYPAALHAWSEELLQVEAAR